MFKEVANEPPRAYVPSLPAVKSSQPQIRDESFFAAKIPTFLDKCKFFGKKVIPLPRFMQ